MRTLILAAFTFFAAPVAIAQEAPAPVHVGDWLVGVVDADTCQAEAHFGDHYLLNVSEDSVGNGHLIFADDRLLVKEGDVKPATYSWDGWKTVKQGNFSALTAPSGKVFLAMETTSAFTEDMAGAKGFWLRVPGVDFDNDFAIPNAGDVVMAVSSCNSKH